MTALARMLVVFDTAANFAADDPVLRRGEMGIETDTDKLKIGDGVTAWSSLDYIRGGTNQTITLTGDVTGSGTGSFATTLATSQGAHDFQALRSSAHITSNGVVSSFTASSVNMDFTGGVGRVFAMGANSSTIGTIQLGVYSSDASLGSAVATFTSALGTVTVPMLFQLDSNANHIIESKNVNTGTAAAAVFRTTSDSANQSLISHAAARTVARCGQTLGGWNEYLALAGGGLLISTNGSASIKIGTNNTLALTIDTSQRAEFVSTVRPGSFTVATLPTGAASRRAFVTDANATTFASVVAGGGANGVPVYHDGTNWRIG